MVLNQHEWAWHGALNGGRMSWKLATRIDT